MPEDVDRFEERLRWERGKIQYEQLEREQKEKEEILKEVYGDA